MKENQHTGKFYSNGKLMITGEYLVLNGAEALALPVSRGQEMKVVHSSGKPCLMWYTYVENKLWFEACFSLPDLVIANTNDFPTAQHIREILLVVRKLNPGFLGEIYRYDVTCRINFDINWGLGSSSSLLANIASWAGIDPFGLHFQVSTGSGYDIAAAISETPVIYKLMNGRPEYRPVSFHPLFQEKLFFGYLGKKRKSSEAVENFRKDQFSATGAVDEISAITRQIAGVSDLYGFVQLLKRHDRIISQFLNEAPVAEQRFSDFNGYVKSLGAWGGDFALFASDYPRDYLISYFRKKDIKHWFTFKDMVKPVKPGIHV